VAKRSACLSLYRTVAIMNDLPTFTEHEDHFKLQAITADNCKGNGPVPFVRMWLADAARRLQRPPASIRILDVGCGRGDTVFWLLDQGWDAWGIDVDCRYVDLGREYLQQTRRDPDRLRAFDGVTYPHLSDWFDIIVSDQVFEHVVDLDALAREVGRVSKPGALGMHIFPARWHPIEAHMRMPVVHWLPKGPPRRWMLKVFLSAHIGAAYFADLPIAERVEIFSRYSDEETFYRSLSHIRSVMSLHGIEGDVIKASRSKVSYHVPWLPSLACPLAGWIYRNAFSVCMETVQI
jgi:SAM-dependent methyltransferase